MSFTTFNTGLSKGSNITLSNGNLTATSGAAVNTGASGVVPKISGKWYFEFQFSTVANVSSGVGIRAVGSTYAGLTNVATLGALYFKTGNYFVDGASIANIGSYTTTQVIGVAVDLDNSKIWFRKDAGSWNNSGSDDPATNTGGHTINTFAPGAGIYPCVVFGNTSGEAGTINFGATSFANTAPSGFTGWTDTVDAKVTIDLGSTATGTATSSSTVAATLPGSDGTNRIIVVCVHNDGTPSVEKDVTSISGGSLTWIKHKQFSYTGRGGGKDTAEIWWALAASALGSTAITATFAGSIDDASIIVFASSGADTTTPFDANAAIPSTNTNTASSVASVTGVSTNSSDGLLLGYWTNDNGPSSGGTPTVGANYTQIAQALNNGGANWSHSQLQGLGFKTVRSSVSVSTTGSLADWGMIATALVPTQGITGTWGSTEAKDIFAASSAPAGVWGSTEAKDVFAGTGYPQLKGVWASTETKDAFAGTVKNTQLKIDTHASGGDHDSGAGAITSATVTLSTNETDETIVLFISNGGVFNHGAVSGVSDTAGLTWTRRKKFSPGSNADITLEVWYANSPGILTSDVITVTSAATGALALIAIGVTGANNTTPWDANVSLPATVDNAGNGNPAATISTHDAHTLLLGMFGTDGGSGVVPAAVNSPLTSFVDRADQVEHNGLGIRAAVGSAIVTSVQTNDSISFTQAGGQFNDRYLIADAIVAAPPANYASWHSTETADVFYARSPPAGAWHSTEVTDHFSGSVFVPPRGVWASTEAKDTFSGAGTASAPLGIDVLAEGGGHDTNTATVALTTSYVDEIIVLGILTGGFFHRAKVQTITDTAGLAWHKRHQRWQVGSNPSMEIWWAKKPLTGATTITVTTEALTGFLAIQAIAITGARIDKPWDEHTGAGYYTDNLGAGNPTALMYSNTSKGMALAFYASPDVDSTGTVSSDFIWADRITVHENVGLTAHLEWAVQLFTTRHQGTPITFGQVGGASLSRAIMTDVIVSASEPLATESTDDLIRFFFDGHGNQQIVAMSGSNNTAQQSFTTFNSDTVAVVCAMVQSGLGARVDHIEDDGNHSGWTRRSIKTELAGSLSLEVWWCQFPAAFSGNVRVVLDSSVRPGDVVGFIVIGINGADVFQRGEIWDGDVSLPKTNSASSASHQQSGQFSSLNANVLELNFAANTGSAFSDGGLENFSELPFLQYKGDFFGSLSGLLNSGTPDFNIALQFKFSGRPINHDSTELNVTPPPDTWMMISDVMPVGPATPPQGTWGSTEATDTFTHTGNFTAIGIASPGGWVGFPPNHALMTPTEAPDRFTGAPFQAPFNGIGWLGWVPAHATMTAVETADRPLIYAWVIGQPLTAQWHSQEGQDRFAASNRATVTGTWGSHEFGDRWASTMQLIPKATPIPARKRRLLIVT